MNFRFISKIDEPSAMRELLPDLGSLSSSLALEDSLIKQIRSTDPRRVEEAEELLFSESFLGHPLSRLDFEQRFSLISSMHVALEAKQQNPLGYCFGYDPLSVKAISKREPQWPEREFCTRPWIQRKNAAIVYQVAILPAARRFGLATTLTKRVCHDLRETSCLALWVLVWPLNLGGLLVAQEAGFRLRSTFKSRTNLVWAEFVKHF